MWTRGNLYRKRFGTTIPNRISTRFSVRLCWDSLGLVNAYLRKGSPERGYGDFTAELE